MSKAQENGKGNDREGNQVRMEDGVDVENAGNEYRFKRDDCCEEIQPAEKAVQPSKQLSRAGTAASGGAFIGVRRQLQSHLEAFRV